MVRHASRTQLIHAMSSAEAELYAIGSCLSECLHAKSFLEEAGISNICQIFLKADSSAGKSIAVRFGISKKARHIQLRFLCVQHLVREGVIISRKNTGSENIAYISTKYVKSDIRQRHLENCGVRSPVLSSGFMSTIPSFGGRPICDHDLKVATMFFESPNATFHECGEVIDFTVECITFQQEIGESLDDKDLAYKVPLFFNRTLRNRCIHLRYTIFYRSHLLLLQFRSSEHCPVRLRRSLRMNMQGQSTNALELHG